MRNFIDAIKYYEKDLKIMEQSLPRDHLDFSATYNNLGATYECIHKYGTSLNYYKKALEICQSSLPFDHPDVIATNVNVARLIERMKSEST